MEHLSSTIQRDQEHLKFQLNSQIQLETEWLHNPAHVVRHMVMMVQIALTTAASFEIA